MKKSPSRVPKPTSLPRRPSVRRRVTSKRDERLTTDLSDEEEELSPTFKRELERRVRDLRDPVRYMITSEFGHGFTLYYNVSDDTYAFKHIEGGTLFKRRATAMAVKALLNSDNRLIRVMVSKGMITRISPEVARWRRKLGNA